MKNIINFIVLLSSLLVTQPAVANDSYYALYRSSRRGSEVTRSVAAAEFIWDKMYKSSQDTQGFVCSLRKLIPDNRGAGFIETVSLEIAKIIDQESNSLRIALLTTDCRPALKPESLLKPLKTIHVDQKGRVISTNPVWNACTQGAPLSVNLMQSNKDVLRIRQGSVRIFRALSCRDYHMGNLKVWKFADDKDVELYLDDRGRLLGDAPKGYVLKTIK